ncbi:MAG: hypothetical protein ABI361_14250 [Nitrososphaera sp.]|jgi:formate hydrogenlyase subunit 3/multisubunit Na+/H+ antiporter MnhD subunit
MSPRNASKIMAAGGAALLVGGFAAMAYLEPAITKGSQQGFKDSQGFWLGWTDYSLIFVIVAGLFLLVYGSVSWQSESPEGRITKARATNAAAAA